MGRDGAAGFSDIQSSVQAFFTPDRADHFQGAGDQFQLLHADFAEGYAIPLPHSGQLVSAGSSRCISREGVPVTATMAGLT